MRVRVPTTLQWHGSMRFFGIDTAAEQIGKIHRGINRWPEGGAACEEGGGCVCELGDR
jgi:hypothetical protein